MKNSSLNSDFNIDFFCSTKSMSEDQKKVFKSIIQDDSNHYIGGNPGTGKSYLLNCLRQYLGKRLVVTSTTGISALNVKGVTLHSFMGFYHINMDFNALAASIIKKSKKKFCALEYLVIEECSMCDTLIFSLLEYCLRQARKNPKPFGGVKVILIGDFMQLPPVSEYGFLFQSDAFKAGNFKIHILTHSHRQSDPVFCQVLSECRTGKLSESSYQLLHERELENVSEDIIRMYATNEEVDAWNNHKFNQIDEPETVYYAKDTAVNEKYIKFFDKNSLIEKELHLKPSARVVLLRNIDTPYGLINGSTGKVISCQPHYVTVEFDNGMVKDIIPYDNEYMVDGDIVAKRCQIPLKLGYAISCHKSQGLTLDKAFIDLKRIFAPGQAYVAISRLRSLDGLFLANLSPKSFMVNFECKNFYSECEELLERERNEIQIKKEAIQSKNNKLELNKKNNASKKFNKLTKKNKNSKSKNREVFNEFVKSQKK